jgi:hypothetical protein
MNHRMTPNQAALEILLDPALSPATRDHKLEVLFRHVTNMVENRIPCPECGDMGPHDDNGRQHDLSYCCSNCGTQWDAEEY